MPDRATPVQSFDADRYREPGMRSHGWTTVLSGPENVSASYARREDGGIRVINQGQSERDGQWSEAEGKAYFVNRPDEAYLKVSGGPFMPLMWCLIDRLPLPICVCLRQQYRLPRLLLS